MARVSVIAEALPPSLSSTKDRAPVAANPSAPLPPLVPEPIAEPDSATHAVATVFGQLDADGDGLITADDLLAVLGDSPEALAQARQIIGSLDTDGDGFVTQEVRPFYLAEFAHHSSLLECMYACVHRFVQSRLACLPLHSST